MMLERHFYTDIIRSSLGAKSFSSSSVQPHRGEEVTTSAKASLAANVRNPNPNLTLTKGVFQHHLLTRRDDTTPYHTIPYQPMGGLLAQFVLSHHSQHSSKQCLARHPAPKESHQRCFSTPPEALTHTHTVSPIRGNIPGTNILPPPSPEWYSDHPVCPAVPWWTWGP